MPRDLYDKRIDCAIENSIDVSNTMSPPRNLHMIINPTSAGGRTAMLQSDILKLVEQQIGTTYSVCITEQPMHAVTSAAEALEQGCTKFLVVGGNGTINEVINGLMQNGMETSRTNTLGIISSGSGEGLARSLGLPRELEEQIRVALWGKPRNIDVAKVSYTDSKGVRKSRLFINESQIGIGAEVVRSTTQHRKRVGGLIAYGLRTLSLVFRYQSPCMKIVVDGTFETTRKVMGIAIGNGAITAGGMRLTPKADLNDGLLNVLIINEQKLPQRVRSFLSIYSGHHGEAPAFDYVNGTSIAVRSDAPVGLSADGEFLGFLPCSIELLPSSIRILRPTHEEVHHEYGFEQITAT